MSRKLLVFLLLLAASLPASAGLDVYLSGNLKGQIRRTPEAGWEGLKQLNVGARLEGDNRNIKATAVFGGLGDQFTWLPVNSGFPSFDFKLKRIALSTEAPLYFGGNPVVLSFGDVAVNYSPLLARMDDSIEVGGVIYNPMVRGVSMEGLKLPVSFPARTTLEAAAFMLWDSNAEPDRMQRAVGGGAKLGAMLWGNKLELVTAQRGDVRQADRTIEKTSASWLLELARESAADQLKLELATDQDTASAPDSSASKQGAFQHLTYTRALDEGIEGSVAYAALDEDFDPLWRDRTPRFNEEGKATGWNALDGMRFIFGLPDWQLYSQRQLQFGLNVRQESTTLAFNLDYRALDGTGALPDGTYQGGKVTWQAPAGGYLFSGRAKVQRLTFFGMQSKGNDLGWQLKLGLSRPLLENDRQQLSLSYRWYHEQVNPEFFGSLHSLQLEQKIKAGSLAGAAAFAGLRQERALPAGSRSGGMVYVCGLTYQTKQGIELEARWSSKNRQEDPSVLYDYEGEEYVGYDNIFRVGVNTAF